jgi:hypothetical protein
LEKLGDRLLEKVEDVLLGGKVWKDVTELHVGEIAWALDQKSFMIFELDEFRLLFLIEDGANPNQDFQFILRNRPYI